MIHRIFTLAATAAAAGALFSGATTLSPAAQAASPDYFTVIAYSPVTGWVGWSNNATTMSEATHIALGNCSLHGDGCTVAAWAQNGCVALALGTGQWSGAWGATAAEAQNAALAKVSSGRIVETHCTGTNENTNQKQGG
jgi:hypothetical protein